MISTALKGTWSMVFVLAVIATAVTQVQADSPAGQEGLGPLPDALRAKVRQGSDLVSDGTGLVLTGSGFVEINLPFPAESTIEAVLLYWNGFHTQASLGPTDVINIQDTLNDGSKMCAGSTVECDSDNECLQSGEAGPCNVVTPTPVGDLIAVTGQLIGGPTFFFNQGGLPSNSSTYRADITDLVLADGLLEIGNFNQILISVNGVGFDRANNGASILVVVKEPGIESQVRLQDGQDLAFCGFPDDRQQTLPVVFDGLVPVEVDRFLEITMLAGSVEGVASAFDPLFRPNEVTVMVSGPPESGPATTSVFYDPFASRNGDEWDNVCNTDVACPDVVGELETLRLPQNQNMVTVQAFSRDAQVCSLMPTQACTTNDDCPGEGNECAFRGEGASSDCDLTIDQRPASFVLMASAISVEEECVLQLDKQVSCDGGETWVDITKDDDPQGDLTQRCTGWDDVPPGEEEVVVRYLTTTSVLGDLNLFNCELSDPSVLLGQDPLQFETLPGNVVSLEIFRTDALECGTVEGDPELATLVCTCFNPQSEQTTTGMDEAGVDCQVPAVLIEKDCAALDVETGEHAVSILVTNPDDPRGASLANCVVEDPAAGFQSAAFDLAPGESMQFGTSVPAGTDVNSVSVVCDIVGATGKTIEAVDSDPCENCAVTVDKEVSCDGGATFGEDCLGWDDDDEVLVRYTARAPEGNDGTLVGCTITDSNGMVLDAPVDVPDLGPGGEFVFTTQPLTCSDALDDNEPDTATITCECLFEDESRANRSDSDMANFECQQAAVEIEKDCAALDVETGEHAVSILVTNPANPRGASLANCQVDDPEAGFQPPAFSLAPGETMQFDTTVPEGTAVNTVSVVCDIVGATGKTVEANDSDPCENCAVTVDKEVSCDGGTTFGEDCLGWDDDDEVLVRYTARAPEGNDGTLVGCTITDSNGMVLDAPVDVPDLGPGGEFVFTTQPLTCSDALDDNEPDTATITCECLFEDESRENRSDSDMANFECQQAAVEIEKDCAALDVETGEHAVSILVTNPANPRGASLANCQVDDPEAGFQPPAFSLAPGETMQFDTTVPEGTAVNTVSVVCDIVGAPGKTVEANDSDPCENCAVTVDKEVSCDGGTTFGEDCLGWDDDDEVLVRYTARAPEGNDGTLVGCTITDSNGMVLDAPVDVPDLGPGGEFVFTTQPLTCSDALDDNEPDTATITCECLFEDDSRANRSDSDMANFECQQAAVEIEKDCAVLDVETGEHAVSILVTNPANPRGASLANCQVDDPEAGFQPPAFSLAPGETMQFDTTVPEGTAVNTVSVVCDIVGAPGKTVEANDSDPCENCAVTVDKEVSCDGGTTFGEDCLGWDDDDEVLVRYTARAPEGNDGTLVGCTITDSNGMVLDAPVDVPDLGPGGEFVFTTNPLTCSDALDDNEPDTATITCECLFEDDSRANRSDSDMANFECQQAAVEIEKDCAALDVETGEHAVSILVTNPANPRGASLANCQVDDPEAGFQPPAFSLAPGETMQFDTTVPEGTAVNTVSVVCDIVGATGKTVEANDSDPCENCAVTVDKEVSCDGGATFGEDCLGWDDDDEVLVRYTARAPEGNDGTLVGCTITDSNGMVLDAPVDVPDLGPGGEFVFTTQPLTCSDALDDNEPDTATITCECLFEDDSRANRSDSDMANFECQQAAVEIEKDCAALDVETGEHAVSILVTNPANPRGASLANCQVDDSEAGFQPPAFSLAPGETMQFDTTVPEGTAVNTVSVVCDIVGATGKTVEANDSDPCENCAVTVDKEVSCDGGATFGEDCLGWDDDDEVLVRYTARAPEGNDGTLVGCTITDSNGMVLDAPVDVPDLGPGGEFVFTTQPLTCSDALDDNEPDTATITCECLFEDESRENRSDSDMANFECQQAAVEIEKDCAAQDAATGENQIDIVVTNPANARGASLANCVVEDPLAGFTSEPFDLAPGETRDFQTSAVVDPDETINTATVTCDIVGTVDKSVTGSADDPCEICGDGEVNRPEETCDPPGSPAGDLDNTCREDCTFCGDGMKQDDEECDPTDPNDPNVDNCNDQCMIPCGNGVVEPDFDETCDPPGSPAGDLGNTCREDCTFCGDGMKDETEECDPTDPSDPNREDCTDQCILEFCGDGLVNRPEETCDPPGSPAGDLGNTCREDCTFCGDGMKDETEECDPTDPNDPNRDECTDQCILKVCGDGEVNRPVETCDPPGSPAGELGNTCREDCTFCGDGIKQDDEECDPTDSNDPNVDNCNNQCMIPCGNGVVEPDFDETCDPPGSPAGDLGNTCREDCTFCGDGMKDDTEECDPTDPDDPNREDCTDQCILEVCGDGEVNRSEETCDPPGEPAGELGNLCRDNCTVCGDGNTDPEEECDPTNRNDPNRSVCNDDCIIEELCELAVMKTCFVPGRDEGDDDDDDDDDCAGKVLAMKLEYTGDGCDVLTNPQGGKAECTGGAGGAEPVSIRVTDNRGEVVYGQDDVVLLGDIVEASAANAGTDKFGSQTDVTIDDGLEEVTFHTSCSQPLQVGDQFGSVRLVELTTTEGGVITLPDEDPDPAEGQKECVISPVPAEPHCDGKVKVLTMKYVGGNCDDSMQDQGDKFSCSGDAGMSQPVQIICDDYLDSGEPASVNIGDLVDIAAANGGDTTLGSQTDCWVKDEFGNWLQDLSFHTSCSKPLNLGDRFGSLEVFSMETTGSGFVGLGQNVIYTYKITNNSDVAAVNVTVVDDQLGPVPGSPIAFIPAHGMVTLQTNALLSEDTTNIVVVNGELESGAECPEATDFSIVRVEEPPEGEIECTSKVKATLLTYIGPDIAGPVTVQAIARTSGTPAVYEFPDGLTSGTTVSSPAENGFTIDATTRGETDLGSKMTMRINGVDELHHTSCSTPYISQLPAPRDNPKGQPSTLWFVESFTQKN